jgi:hypothetical protein
VVRSGLPTVPLTRHVELIDHLRFGRRDEVVGLLMRRRTQQTRSGGARSHSRSWLVSKDHSHSSKSAQAPACASCWIAIGIDMRSARRRPLSLAFTRVRSDRPCTHAEARPFATLDQIVGRGVHRRQERPTTGGDVPAQRERR